MARKPVEEIKLTREQIAENTANASIAPMTNQDVAASIDEAEEEAVKITDKIKQEETDKLDVDIVSKEAPEVVRVKAVFNRMRNPYTEAIFTKNKVTDVIDLQSKENSWTRDQIAAKVLVIVK